MTNLDLIEEVAEALGDIRREVVFLGGSAVGLIIKDPAAPETRATDDVDLVSAVSSRREYRKLQKALEARGFREGGPPICRWQVAGIKVDIVPVDETILGFSSRWYGEVVETPLEAELPSGLVVLHANPAAFLATKFEAFNDPKRANAGDYVASHDIQDIIAVVDGRDDVSTFVTSASRALRGFVARESKKLLSRADHEDLISMGLRGDPASQARLPLVLERFRAIARI